MVDALERHGHFGYDGFWHGSKCTNFSNSKVPREMLRYSKLLERKPLGWHTLYMLGQRFVRWLADAQAMGEECFVVTVDLTHCFPSMRLVNVQRVYFVYGGGGGYMN